MSSWQPIQESPGQPAHYWRFQYGCCTPPGLALTCTDEQTQPQSSGGWNTQYFDRTTDLKCPENRYISQWHIKNDVGGSYWVEFRCCGT